MHQEDYLKLLLQSSRILSSTLNLEDVLSKIIELGMEIVSAEASSILLLDEKTNELVFDVALGEKGEQVKQVRLKIGEGIAGWVAEQKKSLIVNDVTKDMRWTSKIDHQFDFVTRSVMAVPLVYKTKLLGVIEVINRRDGTDFDEQSLQILEAFASQAAISVETSILFTNLKTEKEKLELIFSQMSDAAMYIDSSYNIVFANSACKELIGEIKPDIFQTFNDFNMIPPDFNTIFKTKNKTVLVELSHKQRQFYLSGKISSILDDKKNITGYILTFRDVTDEKKEQLLKRSFLSLISHKLKTPLVSIIGYSDLLAKKFDDASSERRAMEVINKEGLTLNSLVDKLLNFTIIESGELKLNKTGVNLAETVKKVLTDMEEYLKDVNLIIDDNLAQVEQVMADREKVEIVLKNLIENAVKFNDKDKKIVRIAKYELNNMAGISVEDNGKGISQEQKSKLFDKFVQIEESFTGQVEGLGLGLALCKLIIEAHSGKIGFESVLDKGSKFYFVIPKT